ncbi:hypothetical protein RKE29_10275 [Streptomyces sp. B1866]|uniref:hypothetical protein n=1 Tax=Streptomyces sp. B1866 TaxID=3075431 RepID=UPI002890A6C2|nr:hypothetical protein [Streptomyces sp. B1866]MDT3397025.1 hypothetical protein [Streptomyces sp. B1866]
MSIRRVRTARRATAAAALTAALVLATAGCGSSSEGKGKDDDAKRAAGTTGAATQQDGEQSEPASDSTETIGEIKGADGVVLTIRSAVRDGGGFVTVNGEVTNHGTKLFNAVKWRSKETEVKSASSISGASLVDSVGKKRYLVLRDTDGECLCTTGLTSIRPGESRPVFAQFPAPPENVTKVDFQVPTMPSVSIELSD